MLDIMTKQADRGGVVWLTTAETAQIIRQELKAAFPGIKFSVRIKEYSGGCSTTVRYTNGPKEKEVKAVVDRVVALTEYQGRKIRTGAGYTFVERDHTVEIFKAIILAVQKKYGLPEPIFVEGATSSIYVQNEWFPDLNLNYHREFYQEFGQWDEKDGMITGVEDLPSTKEAERAEAEWEAIRPQREAEHAAYMAAEAKRQAEENAAKAQAEALIAVAVAAAQAEGWQGKVPAVAFVIEWSESARADCWRVFTTWQEIHQHIRYIAEDAPTTGAYDKTGFVIHWADGSTYGGRLDIQHPSRPADSNDNDLAGHVFEFIRFHAGLLTAETLPSHLDMGQYYGYLRMMGEEHQREMLEFLDKYDLPQADHLGQPLPAAVNALTRAIIVEATGLDLPQDEPEASPMEKLNQALDRLEGLAGQVAADPEALAQFHALPGTAAALGQVAAFVDRHQPEPVKPAQPKGGRFAGDPAFNWL